MNFAEAINDKVTWKNTENGAIARNTTGDALVDLFAVIGSMRDRPEQDIIEMWEAAWKENKELALKMIFYAGNIRGGLGERRVFRVLIHHLAAIRPRVMRNNITLIPYYNRWDSVYELYSTGCEKDMWNLIRAQWIEDGCHMKEGKPISLMAKWLPSVNASSKLTCAMGRFTARALGLTEAQYRKALSKFRKYLKVVERSMSANEWSSIEYSQVPSYAMMNYSNSFIRHDIVRFSAYRHSLEKKISNGTISDKDIKSSTLYPYDLVMNYLTNEENCNYYYYYSAPGKSNLTEDVITEAQWKALPNYIEGGNNILVMADVSGSMFSYGGQPMASSIGLATYFAERNKGYYHGKYLTFSRDPHFITLEDDLSLARKIEKVIRTDVGYSTNLEGAFEEVLNTAIDYHVSPEEMPKALVVISDMEIDAYATDSSRLDFLSEMTKRFNQAGYNMPIVVFWNVAARGNTFHARNNNPYARFVSGSSASTFKTVLECWQLSAREVVEKTLNDPQYDLVKCEY